MSLQKVDHRKRFDQVVQLFTYYQIKHREERIRLIKEQIEK